MSRPATTPRVTAMRRARLKRRLTISEAAAAVGISAETWRRVEQGLQRSKRPGAIADLLGISVEDVISWHHKGIAQGQQLPNDFSV